MAKKEILMEEKIKVHVSKKIKDIFAWLGNFRHLVKDFEVTTRYAENIVRIAMIRLTLKWYV